MIECHQEVVIFHTMAKQVDDLTDKFEDFETFNHDVKSLLKSLLDNQISMKQELFVIRNCQSEAAAKMRANKTQPGPEESTASSTTLPPPSNTSSAPSSSGPLPSSSPKKVQQKILLVGDSITGSLNIPVIAKATESKVKTVRAYGSIKDTTSNEAKDATKYPESNFTDVTAEELKKETVDILIMQAGSVDITNLNTKDNPTANFDYFKDEVIKSAKNFFATAVSALNQHPELKKVILMKQTPRYDPLDVDPLSLKQALAQIFNDSLVQQWIVSQEKEKIYVGAHNFECSGSIRESRYRHTKSGRFDGYHLFGNSGMKALTNSVLSILHSAKLVSDEHMTCPQTLHQQKKKNHWQHVGNARKGSNNQKRYGSNQSFTTTQNRFNAFSGNY